MSKFDVMVSYVKEDAPVAHKLVSVLQQKELKVWYDPEHAPGGPSVKKIIKQAVDNSGVICSVVTPNYTRTYYSRIEAELAQAKEGMLQPVALVPCLFKGDHLPPCLGDRAYVDFRDDKKAAVDKLFRSIQMHLKERRERLDSLEWTLGAVIAVGLAAGAQELLKQWKAGKKAAAKPAPAASEGPMTWKKLLMAVASEEKMSAWFLQKNRIPPAGKEAMVTEILKTPMTPSTLVAVVPAQVLAQLGTALSISPALGGLAVATAIVQRFRPVVGRASHQ